MRRRYVYSVTGDEVERFVAANGVVRDWLGKYEGGTWGKYAAVLCRFFKWLRLVKGVDLSPEELLDEHIVLRDSSSNSRKRSVSSKQKLTPFKLESISCE